MVFVLEDGTGLADANAYVDIAFADTYFANKLSQDWGGKEALKQGHIIIASQYIDERWGSKLPGFRLVEDQFLQVPRKGARTLEGTLIEGVPIKWKQAVCEYALISLNGSLYKKQETESKEIKKKKTTVGPITTEVEYSDSSLDKELIDFTLADSLAKSAYNMIRRNRVLR